MSGRRRLLIAFGALGISRHVGSPCCGGDHSSATFGRVVVLAVERGAEGLADHARAGGHVAVLDSGVNSAMPEIADAVLQGGDTSGRGTDGRTDFDKIGTSMACRRRLRPGRLVAGHRHGAGR